MSDVIHVAAAVLVDAAGEVLVARRHAHAHQGGLWEFPGGKVEPGESALQALRREIHEELGLDVIEARPLIRVPHDYPDRRVLLDVWRVTAFRGEARGREGQPLRWVAPERLRALEFPAANTPIVTAVRLPVRYVITPEPGVNFLDRLDHVLAHGARLLQLRAKTLPTAEYLELARAVCARARACGAQVLLNADPALVGAAGAQGVHLSAQRLRALSARPLPADLWVAASCHDATELAQAARIGADFAVLGPVLPTASHPGASALGWEKLHALTEATALPVFALGGLRVDDLTRAWEAGAQGIAAIRGFWEEDTWGSA